MAYQGITLAVMIGVALGSTLYFYLKSNGHQKHSYNYQQNKQPTYEPRFTTEEPSSRRTNKTARRKRGKKCVICLELLKENASSLKCGHEFHYSCINQWFSQSQRTRCPICSQPINEECIICYELCSDNKLNLPCGHAFHDYCIQKWFQESRSCPLCRAQ